MPYVESVDPGFSAARPSAGTCCIVAPSPTPDDALKNRFRRHRGDSQIHDRFRCRPERVDCPAGRSRSAVRCPSAHVHQVLGRRALRLRPPAPARGGKSRSATSSRRRIDGWRCLGLRSQHPRCHDGRQRRLDPRPRTADSHPRSQRPHPANTHQHTTGTTKTVDTVGVHLAHRYGDRYLTIGTTCGSGELIAMRTTTSPDGAYNSELYIRDLPPVEPDTIDSVLAANLPELSLIDLRSLGPQSASTIAATRRMRTQDMALEIESPKSLRSANPCPPHHDLDIQHQRIATRRALQINSKPVAGVCDPGTPPIRPQKTSYISVVKQLQIIFTQRHSGRNPQNTPLSAPSASLRETFPGLSAHRLA